MELERATSPNCPASVRIGTEGTIYKGESENFTLMMMCQWENT